MALGGVESGVDDDLGLVELGDGAAGFGGFDGFFELGGVGVGDGGGEGELAPGDGEGGGVEGDVASGFHLGCCHAALGEHEGESHGEAAGMSGGEELFGVGAFFGFEAGAEGIGSCSEDAALGGEGAVAGFEVALPDGFCGTFHGWRLP